MECTLGLDNDNEGNCSNTAMIKAENAERLMIELSEEANGNEKQALDD